MPDVEPTTVEQMSIWQANTHTKSFFFSFFFLSIIIRVIIIKWPSPRFLWAVKSPFFCCFEWQVKGRHHHWLAIQNIKNRDYSLYWETTGAAASDVRRIVEWNLGRLFDWLIFFLAKDWECSIGVSQWGRQAQVEFFPSGKRSTGGYSKGCFMFLVKKKKIINGGPRAWNSKRDGGKSIRW